MEGGPYDVVSGIPTLVNTFFTVDMSRERADDLVDLLNRQDAMQRGMTERPEETD
jgi:hypothetical protein